jgi:hypothetical protein
MYIKDKESSDEFRVSYFVEKKPVTCSYSEYGLYKLGCIPKSNEYVFILPAGVSGRLFPCSIRPP